jgi:hypothetical protein
MKPAALLALLLALAVSRPAFADLNGDMTADETGRVLNEDKLSLGTLACLEAADKACEPTADAGSLIRNDRTVGPAPAVFAGHFDRLWQAYPHGSVAEVKAKIGRPGEDWIVNTCVIRVSYAMNQIPALKIDRTVTTFSNKTMNYLAHKPAATADLHYLYRVEEFAGYMLRKFGKPQVSATRGMDMRAAVAGKKGVILFVVKGWTDATGHFDLWDGQKAAHQEFFDQAGDVFLWQ